MHLLSRIFFTGTLLLLLGSCGQQLNKERTITGVILDETGAGVDEVSVNVLQGNGKPFPQERFDSDTDLTEEDGVYSLVIEPFKNSEATNAIVTANVNVLSDLSTGDAFFNINIGQTEIFLEDLIEGDLDAVIRKDFLQEPYGIFALGFSFQEPPTGSESITISVTGLRFNHEFTIGNENFQDVFTLPVAIDDEISLKYNYFSDTNPSSGTETFTIPVGSTLKSYTLGL